MNDQGKRLRLLVLFNQLHAVIDKARTQKARAGLAGGNADLERIGARVQRRRRNVEFEQGIVAAPGSTGDPTTVGLH